MNRSHRWISPAVLFLFLTQVFSPPSYAEPIPLSASKNTVPVTSTFTETPVQNSLPQTSVHFLQASPLAAAASSPFVGVEEGAAVSGVVEIRPNQEALPGIKKVAYYLNGSKSGKVYNSPFIWGGVNGDGTTGFDTRTVTDGDYTLAMVYTDATGDHENQIRFHIHNVNNAAPAPAPTPSPSPSTTPLPSASPAPIPAQDRTAGGLVYPASTSFVDVAQAGNLSFVAEQNKISIINAANQAQPQVVSSVEFSNGPILDIEAENGVIYVLERGVPSSQANPGSGIYDGNFWRIDVSNPANPVKQLVDAGIVQAKRILVTAETIYIVHSFEYALIPCAKNAGGLSCGIPTEQYRHDEFYDFQGEVFFSATAGESVIHGGTSDIIFNTPTSAPIASMNSNAGILYATLKNGTVEIFDTHQVSDPNTQSVPRVKVLDLQGNDPIASVYRDGTLAVLDSTGLIEVFDVSNLTAATRVDSVTVPGARRLDFDGGYVYAVTGNEYRIVTRASSPSPTPSPFSQPAAMTPYLGVQEGQTVSGTVSIRPNPNVLSGIKKVAYYLNGAKSGKIYEAPFTWGGSTGFDTRTLADGEYELSMVYTDAFGDHEIKIRFRTDN